MTKPLTADEIIAALENRTVAEAAKALGVSERTLYRRMRDLKIRRVPVQEAA